MSTAKPDSPVANGTANGYKTGDKIFKGQASTEANAPKAAQISELQRHGDLAHKELARQSIAQVELSAAMSWGGRALASFEKSKAGTGKERLRMLCEGESYRDESLEHAALSDDPGALLTQIIKQLEPARTAAWEAIEAALESPSKNK